MFVLRHALGKHDTASHNAGERFGSNAQEKSPSEFAFTFSLGHCVGPPGKPA